MTTTDEGYPLHVPDVDDTSDFPHSILKPQDGDPTVDYPTMGDPHGAVVDTFGGIQHAGPGIIDDAKNATSLVDIADDEAAVTQDARWARGLVTNLPGARGLHAQTEQVSGAQATRIVRENKFRRTVTVFNPPAPVGDGASVLWLAPTQAQAKVNVGFPLVPGASYSGDYSGDLWAISSNANGSIVSVIAPIYVENLQ